MEKEQKVVIKRKQKISNGFLSVIKLIFSQVKFNGGKYEEVTRELLQRDKNVIFLTLFDEKEKKLLFVKQVRPAALFDNILEPYTIEPIAGMVEEGQTPIQAAIREAKEEANIELEEKDLVLLKACYLSPGISNEYGYFYFANFDSTKYKEGVFGLDEESEDIEAMVVHLDEVENLKEKFSVATLISYLSAKLN